MRDALSERSSALRDSLRSWDLRATLIKTATSATPEAVYFGALPPSPPMAA